MDIPNHAELFGIAKREYLFRNSKITEDVIDTEGSDANIICNISASLADEVIRHLIHAVLALWVDTAAGEKLDRLAYDRYGLSRRQAAREQVILNFSRPDVSYGAADIPLGTTVSTSDGIKFTTTLAATLGATETATSITAHALVIGANQVAAAGELTRLANALEDSTITVTNSATSAF